MTDRTLLFHPRARCAGLRRTAVWLALWAGVWGPLTLELQGQQLNEMCPVMTAEAADPEITVVYQGKTVAFCCDGCVNKFQANPEKYLPRLPQFAAAAGGAVGNEVAPEDPQVPWSGRVHPAVVHFPLAGIPLALLGYGLWLITAQPSFARADVVPLIVGTAGAIAAVLTGDIAHENMRFSADMGAIAERHEWCSTAAMILAVALTVLRVWRWSRLSGGWRWLYLGGLAIATTLLAITGYLGGSLVFGPDHLAWP